MGGGIQSPSSFTSSPDEDDQSHCSSDGLGFDQLGNNENSSNKAPLVGNLRTRHEELPNVISNYLSTRIVPESLNEAKQVLMSYRPGSWVDKEDGESLSDFDVPKATTLLVVGFRGSGKSSLINRVSRLFGDNKSGPDRAQVSYGSGSGDGTCFLHGYMIPKQSGSFCLFDTRSLSDQIGDGDDDLIKSWMTKGVRHGELVTRESDDPSLKDKLACKVRYGSELDEPVRKVNSVIFVVDGQSILRCMEGDNEEATRHCQMLARTYNSPYFAFRDDKPTIVVTRGDLLIHEERARVRMYLGELLGVPPEMQIFHIPEGDESVSELNTLKMLKYTLGRADKNLPRKNKDPRDLPLEKFAQVLEIIVKLVLIASIVWSMREILHTVQGLACSKHLESLVNGTHHLHESLDNCTRNDLAQIQYCNLHKHPTEAGSEPINQTFSLDVQHPETRSKSDQTMQSKPNQRRVKEKPYKMPAKLKIRLTKHKAKAHKKREAVDVTQPTIKAKAHKKREAVEVVQPTINWKARQRLWFQE